MSAGGPAVIAGNETTDSCLGSLLKGAAVFVAAVAVSLFLLPSSLRSRESFNLVVGAGAFCMLVASLYYRAIAAKRVQKQMLVDAANGVIVEGRRAAFVGRLEGSASYTSPLTLSPAVIYTYEIGHGHPTTFFRGEAWSELSLATPSKRLRLLCRPHLTMESSTFEDRDLAHRRFDAYLGARTFTKAWDIGVPKPGLTPANSGLEYHRDEGYEPGRRGGWTSLTLSEKVVAPGEAVTIFGVYSPEVGGIVAGESQIAELYRGNAAGALATFDASIRFYRIAGVAFFLSGVALVTTYGIFAG